MSIFYEQTLIHMLQQQSLTNVLLIELTASQAGLPRKADDTLAKTLNKALEVANQGIEHANKHIS